MSLVIRFEPGLRPVIKHQEHDQSSHGNWATGGEMESWNPNDPIPVSPRNAGGMTQKIWDNWEHGVDGNQYVELYRQYAGEALGIAVPKSSMDVGGNLNYLTQRGFGGSSTDTVRKQSETILQAIANGKSEQPALYRGMTATDADGQALLNSITKLKAGDTLDMPLVSTTRSLGVATWYAADRTSGTSNVIMKIQPGAKGVSLSKETSRYPQDHEVITSGKFEVVSVNTIQSSYWQRGILEPRKVNYTDGSESHYEVATYSPRRYSPEESKTIYETVTSGKYTSLETPTFKVTNDRHNNYPDRPKLSTWEKQPEREFTVVEVKFIEPHVIRKAKSNDYGLTFDALFNTIPFIREEEIAKHAMHDQKTHGSWATGQKGGSGLSHREMFELKKQPDPIVKKVYEAEEKNHNQIQDKNTEEPSGPNRVDFDEYSDYKDAYKKYSKDFLNWSRKVTTSVISPTGKKHLDGTPTGVNGYIRDVLRQDWFIEAFGKGGVAGNNLQIVVLSTGEAGAYQIGFKGSLPVSILRVNRGYSKAEPTIIHEIAHYATTISATSPHAGHGVEFARNHIYIAGKVMGNSFADGLEKSYREAGVPLGD